MDTLNTFWDNTTHYKTKSVHFLGLTNSATKKGTTFLRVPYFRKPPSKLRDYPRSLGQLPTKLGLLHGKYTTLLVDEGAEGNVWALIIRLGFGDTL